MFESDVCINIFSNLYLPFSVINKTFFTDHWDYSTIQDIRSVFNTTVSNTWIQVYPVIPMSSYKVQVNASNTAGYILSNTVDVNMPEGSE